ncbi:E3 ubiquitin-protein ligase synoviolin [Geodia barretti]|uniref:RING-type E3 ubiquitin transferase n=1 Tax=Geodia barretti TaxID=519541 RepID=A0AA35X468_GEOBA|nr:E3 ubiquitin-protein ligase synoviolin [Geodia barretti]
MKPMVLVTLATSALTALVVGNAYSQKRQFYTTLVYLLNSNRTLGVLYVQAAVMLWVTTTVVKNLFFGTLRAAEVEHLVEKSWYMVLETFILLAGFHEDMQVGFVTTITFLFVIKAFHWLIEERINYMERSPLIAWTFHLRAVSILFLLAAIDLLYIRYSWASLRTKGASVQIVFGLEYTIMLLVGLNTFLHYVLHSIDLRSEDPWENKTIYMRYVDIGVGFMKLCLYMSYMLFMMWILFIPLHIARRIFITAKHFQKSVNDVLSSHQAIRNLNTLYPDATEEELRAANTVCIICREDMLQRCKRLPCKHIFHTSCLRSWFQRQQNCPTCRMDVLSHSASLRRNRRLQQQQHGPPQDNTAQGGANNGGEGRSEGTMSPPAHPHTTPPPPPFPPGFPAFTPFSMPPFMMQPPFGGGMGGGGSLAGLTDDQLRSLEGLERANVEARIAVLRNIQRLLDSAVTQMVQYSTVMTNMGNAVLVCHSVSSELQQDQDFLGTPILLPLLFLTPDLLPLPLHSSHLPLPLPLLIQPLRQPLRLLRGPLLKGQREYSFTAGQLDPQKSREREEGEEEEEEEREEGERRGLFTVGETNSSSASIAGGEGGSGGPGEGSPAAVDELRQRRLQRFHSLPAVSQVAAATEDSMSSASKTDGHGGTNGSSTQSPEKEQ